MIWIYEELSESEIESMKRFNPLMDYRNGGKEHVFNTSWGGWVIKGGVLHDIRKIRFFEIYKIRKGFICDEFEEAVCLSKIVGGFDFDFMELKSNYPFISTYIEKNKNNFWLDTIAIPVLSFIEHNALHNRSLLDHLQVESLREHNIEIRDYIPIKIFPSGDIIQPRKRKGSES
jgi:hypothetical protein